MANITTVQMCSQLPMCTMPPHETEPVSILYSNKTINACDILRITCINAVSKASDEIYTDCPITYRTWQLLRMTCRALRTALRDYHAARGIYIMSLTALLSSREELSYSVFIDRLLLSMINDKNTDDDHMVMAVNCVRDSCGTLTDYNTLLRWDNSDLTIRAYGVANPHTEIISLDRAATWNPNPCRHTRVGDQFYRVYGDAKALYSWLYDYLPEIYSEVRVWKSLDRRDRLKLK